MKIIKLLLACFALFNLISCSSSLQLVSDYDVTADFSSYKTYMFLPWNKDNSEYIAEAGKKKLYALLEKEFASRGYSKVNSGADVAVNLMALLDEKRSATRYTRYYSTGGYGYYSPFGYGIQSTTYYKKEDILEGSIIVDVFDENTKTLVWQGVAILEIVENNGKRERQVSNAVSKMFFEYPKRD